MCGGNKTTETTQTQSSGPPGYITEAYKDILSRAQGVAGTPYNPATEKQIAGFTDPQFQAFQGVQGIQGAYSPYLQNASDAVAAGIAPISTQSILANYNPYIQAQTDALQANLNEQNAQTLQQVNSNAARIGALTGDRSQIAAQQAINDNNRNAASALANLQSNAFGQAANLAQGNQQASLQGAGLYGNLAGAAQQYGYNDVNALLGIGGLQQQQGQAVLDAASQNAQAQSAYPFTTTQWLAGIASGLAPGAGTTSTGVTSQPGPNPWSQVLGAGLAGLSLLKTGGAVKGYDQGGGVPYDGAPSYIPNIAMGNGPGFAPGPSLAQASAPDTGMQDVLSSFTQAKSALGGLGRLGERMRTTTDPKSGWSTTVNPSGLSGWSNYMSSAFGRAHGGGVKGYDDGGVVEWDDVTDVDVPVAPHRMADVETQNSGGIFGLLPVSDNARQGLLTAGLGMLASRSPHFGTAVGEGGLAGVGAYRQAEAQAAAEKLKRETLDAQAARLEAQAQQAAERLKLQTRQIGETERHNRATEAKAAAENAAKYGKTGAIFRGPDNKFYSVQFADDGTKLVEPVGSGLSPSKGTAVVGNEVIDEATGLPVRDVSAAIAGGKQAEIAGKATAELQASMPKLEMGFQNFANKSDRLINAIDRAISRIGPWTTGYGAGLQNLPATDARALARDLDTVRANIGFEELQAMRDASPTGGALGQVSEMENRLLQSVRGAMDQYDKGENLEANLKIIRDSVSQLKQLKEDQLNADRARASGGSWRSANPAPGAIPSDAVDLLRQDPSEERKRQFDEIFGNGEADKLLRAP